MDRAKAGEEGSLGDWNCRGVEAEHKVLVLKHPCAIPSPKYPSTEGTCSVLEPFPEEEGSLLLLLTSEDPQFFPLFILSLETNKQKKVFERQLKLPHQQRQEICPGSLTVVQAVLRWGAHRVSLMPACHEYFWPPYCSCARNNV